METLANAFDQPLDSHEHQQLRQTVWLGGDHVTVRYWLGRLLDANFFRESDEVVKVALRKYFADQGCEKGAVLVADFQSWGPVAMILKQEVERIEAGTSIKSAPQVEALRAVMENPDLTDGQLAVFCRTTEKQITRMSCVLVLRKLWRQLPAQLANAQGK